MNATELFGRLNADGQLVGQLVDHKGLAEIYVHLGASIFLFAASLLTIFVIWLSFGRQGQGWFALRMGVFFIGLIGLGEAGEHFFAPQGHDFFHYLHMLGAPMSMFFLYLAVKELRLLYFDLEPKRMIGNNILYLLSLSVFIIAGLLGYQAKANWDATLELPFLTISLIPTFIIAYMLIRRSTELYQEQNRVSLFKLSIFSTTLALIPLLAWGTIALAVIIWLGRVADFIDFGFGYMFFHSLQDMLHAGLGASLMGSSFMLLMSRDTKAIEDHVVQSTKLASLGEITVNTAADLNNPLMAIIGYATLLLEDEKIPTTGRRDIEMIQQEASRAAKITKDLLDYAGKHSPRFQVIDIEIPLDQSISLMQSRLRQVGIAVVKNMRRPLPFISADLDQMRQVFVNVMNNSIDAMPRGGRLEIYVEKGDSAVEIRFADTGDGIPEAVLSRIFEPFFSLKPESGTGLGLSLAQSVIQQHRGTIDVSSQVNLGTTVTIELPAVPDEESSWYSERDFDAISKSDSSV